MIFLLKDDPDKSTTCQWKVTLPKMFGQNKLALTGLVKGYTVGWELKETGSGENWEREDESDQNAYKIL